MKNNLLASIALFGIYRNSNQDTYDLVAQYISAVIAQKEYDTFKTDSMQSDLKELYQIDIPIGVINSVCKNRIEGLSLNKGVFTCSRIPKDEIENEYAELISNYDDLFTSLIAFVKNEAQEYKDQTIKDRFTDYLVEGCILDAKLNNLFAAFIASHQESKDIRQKIDLLSSGLISYNGLSYTDSAGNSGAWTDKLTIYLDTEFLFSCAGYNGPYLHTVFQELYELVKEINTSYHRRTKKQDNLVELKYLRDTRDVYLSLINSAKMFIDSKGVPDPSKRALVRIISESDSVFDVDTHRARIDTAVKDIYQIQYDDNDYSTFITDRRFIIFDEATVTALTRDYNPHKDEATTRKIDYYARVYTIINGLRGGKSINIFEKCRYIFLTGSRIGRGTSVAARPDSKSVTLATDIDYIVSRFWFKLNKQLTNNQIPVSLDIVARSQAVLTREVSRKVKALYEELKLKDLSEPEQKSLYANLTEAEKYLAPISDAATKDVLAFIDYKNVDELIEDQRNLRRKVAEAEKKDKELFETKGKLAQKENEIEGLKKDITKKEQDHQQKQSDASEENIRLIRTNKWLIGTIAILAIVILLLISVLVLRLNNYSMS